MKNLSLTQYGAIAVLLFCITDFAVRLTPDVATKSVQSVNTDTSKLDVVFLSQQMLSTMQNMLAEFDVKPVEPVVKTPVNKVVAKPKVSLMSKEKQKQQSGSMSFFYDGEDKYQLIATFYDSKKRFVLLQKQHLPSKKITTIKRLEGEKISVYKLDKIHRNFVVLSEQQRTIELQLFTNKSTK